MAIVSSTFTQVVTTDNATSYLYYLKEFLKTSLGYVVRGSNDGTTAAFDGVDRLTSIAIFNAAAGRWIVLEDPGGSFQLLFARGTADGRAAFIKFNPLTNSGPAYSGGTTTTHPTAARERAVFDPGSWTNSSVTHRYHFTGQNTSPYGFATMCKTSLGAVNTSQRGGMAVVPIDLQPGVAGCPYWCFVSDNATTLFTFATADLANQTTASGSHGIMQIHHPTTGSTLAPAAVAALAYYQQNSSGMIVPNGLGLDNGRDQMVPVPFGQEGFVYVGTSTFMQWTGTARNNLDTFNSMTRIVFGQVSFPWDGVTNPVA